MTIFKTVTIAAAGAVLLSAQAMAATSAPLPPGKPAGARQAELESGLLVPMGLAGAAVVALVAVTSDAGGTSGNPVITTATPTGTAR